MKETAFNPVQYLEKKSKMRENFIRKRFSNGVDVIRFYWFLGRTATIPVLGTLLIRPVFNLYNRYVDSNAVILPMEEIEKIIESSDQFFVDPCDCRLEYQRCDSPLYTCLRINTSARMRREETGKQGLTRENAIEIARNAHNHGLVMCLEECIQPYQFNICMCCSCCCIQHRFRYELGLKAFNSGPYLPDFDSERCVACGECQAHCGASAIALVQDRIQFDISSCLGCGICASVCPEKAIEMKLDPERIRMEAEPGWMRLLLIRLFMYGYIFPMFFIFRIFAGSHQYKRNGAEPRNTDLAINCP